MSERTAAARGFVLLTVLWVLAGTSSLAVAVALLGRTAVDETSNDIAAARSYWDAEECAAVLIDAADSALREIPVDSRDPQRVWRLLDRYARLANERRSASECDARLESNGGRLDLNRSSEVGLRGLAVAVGIAPSRADSLVAAILDWRDADDVPRIGGAEAVWYESRNLLPPRNGQFASEHELEFVRGFADLTADQRRAILASVGVDADPIDLWHAPGTVLQSLPGFSESVTQLFLTLRASNSGVSGMPQLLALLQGQARDSVESHYPELVTRTETQPDRWRLVAEGRSGEPTVTTRIELLLGLGDKRVSVIRRRYWIE